MIIDRIVHFRARTILGVVGILLAVGSVLYVLWVARHVLSWLLIALFLALALNPVVEWLQRHGVKSRGFASGIAFLVALGVIVGLGALFIPTLVDQVNDFANKVPDYLDDLTNGRGRLGFLETKYHLVDKAREAVNNGGAAKLLGRSGTAVAVTKGVITAIVASLTIMFMTFFMLLEGPEWVDRFFSCAARRTRSRAGAASRTTSTARSAATSPGNLLISLIAGVSTTIVLLITGSAVRGRARADRRDPRSDPARGRDDRRDHRRLRRVPARDHGRRSSWWSSSSSTSSSRTT